MPHFSKAVLLVDDNPADRTLFSRLIQSRIGAEVFATGDPDKAIARLVSGDIGCVVTDQAMPVSGHELVQLVKAVRSDIGIIFLSNSEAPAQPLSPGVRFVNKDGTDLLVSEILNCMSRWALQR